METQGVQMERDIFKITLELTVLTEPWELIEEINRTLDDKDREDLYEGREINTGHRPETYHKI